MIASVGRSVAGIATLCLGALVAHGLSPVVGVNELLLAIAIGVVLTNGVGIPDQLRAGVKTHKIWLAAGIVLLGASLTVDTVLEIGTTVLFLLVGVVALTLFSIELMARNVGGLTEKFGSLLAAGAGICGVSAVVAVGSAVRARETQIAYAAGVVLVLDAVMIVVYPAVGAVLDLSGVVFGVWTGVSMLSTGPAVAVGFTHSETAGQWATMTKLARNTLIGVVALGYASYYVRRESGDTPSVSVLWTNFPKFVLGFIALVALASAGVFSPDHRASIATAVDWLFLLAFVGLGTEIRTTELRQTGITPLVVVLTAVAVTSFLTLVVALTVL
jgi:uncharacterized integral membrane protein (TIGR00698 family)